MNDFGKCAAAAAFACAILGAPVASAQDAPLATAGQDTLGDLLARDQVAIGWFVPARTAEAAAKAGADPRMDFVFFNMEAVESYKPAEMQAFIEGMRPVPGGRRQTAPPLMARIPVFHDDPAAARLRTSEVVRAGAQAVVFPGMETAEEAQQALDAVRVAASGRAVASVFIVESELGVANARAITRLRPSVAIPGPGTLRRVYQGDMVKVEHAIQVQLAACKEFDVPCGITANASDVAKRVAEGFRVIIIYDRDYDATIDLARGLAGRAPRPAPPTPAEPESAIELWNRGATAFGVFVPDERPRVAGDSPAAGDAAAPLYTREGAARLGANPLYDYLFLNLEGRYDASAIRTVVAGLGPSMAAPRKTLIVRIPPIAADGVDAARARVAEALRLGADGVALPHIRSVDDARQAVGFFTDAGANVWSRANPNGTTIAMLMIEDADTLAQAAAIADVGGYSVLACGIGSLTRSLNGDRAAAERGTQAILAETKRVKAVNMLTATTQDVESRVQQGFDALLAIGPDPDAVIAKARPQARR